MFSLLLGPRRHFCLLSRVPKNQLFTTLLWLLFLLSAQWSAPHLAVTAGGVKTQFAPCANTAWWQLVQTCRITLVCLYIGRMREGGPGGCFCGLLCVGPSLVLRNSLSLPWAERPLSASFWPRECNKWMLPENFKVVAYIASIKQTVGVEQQGICYMGGKRFLAGRNSWDSLCPSAQLWPFPTGDQSFSLPLQHFLMVFDLPTLPPAQEIVDCKEKRPHLNNIIRVQANANSYLSVFKPHIENTSWPNHIWHRWAGEKTVQL